MTERKAARRGRHPLSKRAERLEWTIGAASALLVLALLGFLAYEAVVSGSGLAELDVELGEPRLVSGMTYQPVSVHNRGRRTVADVQVEGTRGEQASSVTLSYIGRGSHADAVLIFPGAAAGTDIEVEVKGYIEP